MSATWLSIPADTVEETNSVVLRFENQTRRAIEITPSLIAEGLDQRRVERGLEPVTVDGAAVADLTVDLRDAPIQSPTYSSQLHVRVSYSHPEQEMAFFLSDALYYHFDARYTQATIYNERVMREQLGGGQLVSNASNLQGRLWIDGSWVDLDQLREDEWRSDGGSDLPPPISGHWWGSFEDEISVEEISQGCWADGTCDTICGDVATAYVDEVGDYGTVASTHCDPDCTIFYRHPAAYARARITHVTNPFCTHDSPDPSVNSCIELAWDGHLDASGCAHLDLAAGQSYQLWLLGGARKGPYGAAFEFTEYDDDGAKIGELDEVRRVRMGFAWPHELPTGERIDVPGTKYSYALATASRLLQIDTMTTSEVAIDVDVNRTNAAGGISAWHSGFYTGKWTLDGMPSGLQHKYILTHEAGHVVQHQRIGELYFGYHDVTADESLCQCLHVDPDRRSHCLQSAEQTTTAQVEGFGQFVASRTWNDPGEVDCDFAYYKSFKNASSQTEEPPVLKSCIDPIKWRNNHCPTETWGTEYDWMHFFYRVNSPVASGSDRTTLADLESIYHAACDTLDAEGRCFDDDKVTFQELNSAAENYFGFNTPEANNFLDRANETGVSCDTTP